MANPLEDVSTVNESYSVTVPASVREEIHLESGDKLRWRVDEDGDLGVELIKRRSGAFAALDPIDIGGETDAAEDHDAIDQEY